MRRRLEDYAEDAELGDWTSEQLGDVYGDWLEREGLAADNPSADELLMFGELSPAQRAWLDGFVRFYREVQALEDGGPERAS